jgi:hypothetical protein
MTGTMPSDQELEPIAVDEKLFERFDGKQLLQYVRDNDLNGTKEELHKVLDCMKEKYGKEGNKQSNKERKLERIRVYNDLLLLALGAEGDEWRKWTTNDSALKLWDDTTTSKLAPPESTYSYLLDYILHEDAEIMFKCYKVHDHSKRTELFLVESIKVYRMHMFHSLLEAMKGGPKGYKEACEQLLEEEKQSKSKDKAAASRLRGWSERSLRSRVRLHWVLARAKHAPNVSYRGFKYRGPRSTLVQEMIQNKLFEMAKDSPFGYEKPKFDKKDKDLPLGTLKISSLLAWASAARDHDIVTCMLQHKEDYVKSGDPEWEESWRESWAHALWNAAYKGYAEIVQELLSCDEEYTNHFFRNPMPPLHVAVLRGHTSVVEVLCTASKNFSCHDEDQILHLTPIEVASNFHDDGIKWKLMNTLFQRPEVKQAVSQQREFTVNSANAIMVGAALIAGVTYGGWLQPPLGYNTYYQFPEPLPAPPDTFESYMAIQGHMSMQVFAVFNSLSFFCAVEALEKTHVLQIVQKLRSKLKWTTSLLLGSVLFALVAFSSAGIAILPPIQHVCNNRSGWNNLFGNYKQNAAALRLQKALRVVRKSVSTTNAKDDIIKTFGEPFLMIKEAGIVFLHRTFE